MAVSNSHAMRGRIGGLRRAALAPDQRALTEAARRGRFAKYIDKVREALPDLTDEAELIRRAEQLRQADMVSMSLKAAKARRLRRELAEVEADLESAGER